MTTPTPSAAGARDSRWLTRTIGDETFDVLNLRHRETERRILAEMDAGVEVYYDRRWGATELFTRWLLEHPELVAGKRVLALGVGIGLETLALGRLCRHLYVNDLAPVSLELCGEQLEQNGIRHFSPLPGSMATLPLPEVDLAVACFLIYEDETRAAVSAFVDRFPGEILVANGPLPAFETWLADLRRPHETLFKVESAHALRIHRLDG
jgi:predicted nicotinamide N-methyase